MTLSELEKFYQLGNIDGLGFVNYDGLLVEDQLVLSTAAAQVVARSFHEIHKGLRESNRPCRGFLLKLSEHQFVSVAVTGGTLILQLNPSQPINQFFEQALTMVSYHQSGPVAISASPEVAGLSQQQQPQQPQIAQPSQPDSPQIAVVPDEGLEMTWQDFQASLKKALGKVAPSGLVKKLQNDAIEAAGVPPDTTPTLQQMRIIGSNAMNLVPNKGRRKLVEKELNIVFENLGL